jgi:hypothetical protein
MIVDLLTTGVLARRLLDPANEGVVAHVFDRSVYLAVSALNARGPGGLFCIVRPDAGTGPLDARADISEAVQWADLGIVAGARFASSAKRLSIDGRAVFSLRKARLVAPSAWPRVGSLPELARSLSALKEATSRRAPPLGLSRVNLGCGHRQGAGSPLTRRGSLAMSGIADWLADRLAGATSAGLEAAGRSSVGRLIGLGPGLTPSGDDVLAGAMLALHATGRSTIATELASMIDGFPIEATSPISRAHMKAAAEGLPGETIHDAISALLTADIAALGGILDRVDLIGHCSGWDMLSGVALVLSVLVERAVLE